MSSVYLSKKLEEFSVAGKNLSRESKTRIRNIFLSSGIPEKELVILDYKKNFKLSAYAVSQSRKIKIKLLLKRFHVRGVLVNSRIMKLNDWFYRWQRSYQVMPLAKKFLIVPAWKRRVRKEKKRIPIILDPGSAFGTGGHETTRLMVRLLETISGRFRSFLDVGTGSGVLAIVAAKLGGERIVAFDHDAMSAKIAKKNFKTNGGSDGRFFRRDLKRFCVRRKFDVVGANLLSQTLLEHQEKLLKSLAPGGYLVLSGVAKCHSKSFQREFRAPGLRCLKVLYGRSWMGAIYRRASS